MPNSNVQPLFERARALGVGFCAGYAELTPDGHRYNSAVLVAPNGDLLTKYRKVHLPGTSAPKPELRLIPNQPAYPRLVKDRARRLLLKG